MLRYIAPVTISSERDLVKYYIDTVEPVEPNSPKGYSERYIHSEIIKRFPKVNAVIHSYSEAVVPYTILGVLIKPCFHMTGFLGTYIPVYDITKYYKDGDT
jgi:ribulose-5-phosphate 4-epimerase/fuculose-1-phosphate aldolase